MLSRREYLGHTVNFKTKRKEYEQSNARAAKLDAEILRTFIKRIVVTGTMPEKKGIGIEVKLRHT